MRHTIKFPLKSSFKISSTWPVKLSDRSFFIERKDGLATHVSVTYRNLPVDQAPRISAEPNKDTSIRFQGNRSLIAERDLRSWQSILAPYLPIDIDFLSPFETFEGENDEERAAIQISSFEHGPYEPAGTPHDFSVLGRAFLAIEIGEPYIEPTAFYLQAIQDKKAERSIDSYNNLYLMLESMYNIPSKTKAAVESILDNQTIVASIDKTLASGAGVDLNLTSSRLSGFESWNSDKSQLVKSIVELRGFLRHHSGANPRRWNPLEQGKYKGEAAFLAYVCQQIMFPLTLDRTWDNQYAEEFIRQAKELRQMIDIALVLSIKEGDRVREVGLNMSFPESEPTPMLAQTSLSRALDEFEKRSPGAELYGIRARIKPNGPELFRYDLGPSVGRA